MSASCPTASVTRWVVISSVTWPDARASALAVQTCSSRNPFPTPAAFEYPMRNSPPPRSLAGGRPSLPAGSSLAGASELPVPELHATVSNAVATIAPNG